MAGNVVEITGGTVGQDVFGGSSSSGTVTSNTVTISGGDITGDVYGGWGYGSGEAAGNVVEITGTPTFSSITVLYGGHSQGGGLSTANKLKVGTIAIEVLGIKEFQEYEFYNLVKNGAAMVKVKQELDLTGAQVRVSGGLKGGTDIGDMYRLIKSNAGIKGLVEGVESIQEMLVRYDYEVGIIQTNELAMRVKGIEVNGKSKALTQGRVGSMIFVGEGISRRIRKEMIGEQDKKRYKVVGVVMGASSKHASQIEVAGNVAGVGVIRGVGKGVVLGGYVEYGKGSYSSKEDIGELGEVRGKGDSEYVGVGIIGEVEVYRGLRVEAGMRVGRYGNNFESKDMGIGEKQGEEEKYESKGDKYVGGQIGVGYKIESEDKKEGIEMRCNIEVSGVGEEEVELKTGEEVKFGRMEIGKVRSECIVWKEIEKKGRDICKYKIKPYVGIGSEYERVEEGAKYGQVDIESSKVRGVSVIGDVGVEGQIWKIGVRCGCECYVGNRQGVRGLSKTINVCC